MRVINGLLLFLIVGCSNYSKIRENYTDSKSNLVLPRQTSYSKRVVSNKSFKVVDVVLENGAISTDPLFTKEKTFVLPLLAFNSWKHITRHQVGTIQFKNDIKNYIRYSFEEGLKLAGAKVDNVSAELELGIRVKRLKGYADYEKSGYFFFLLLVYGFGEFGYEGPFVGDVLFEIDIKDGDRKFTREVSANVILNKNEFNEDFADNHDRITRALENAIGQSIQEFIEVYPR